MKSFPKQFYDDCAPYGDLLEKAARPVWQRQDARADSLQRLIRDLPGTRAAETCLAKDRVAIGGPGDLSAEQKTRVEKILTGLKPWRKGPFEVFGIQIDSEWNSAMKWRRVAPHMAPLAGRRILDVGSSNGYYLFRMAADRPRLVLGIEPYATYYYQFMVLQHFSQIPGIYTLPLGLEDLSGIVLLGADPGHDLVLHGHPLPPALAAGHPGTVKGTAGAGRAIDTGNPDCPG